MYIKKNDTVWYHYWLNIDLTNAFRYDYSTQKHSPEDHSNNYIY